MSQRDDDPPDSLDTQLARKAQLRQWERDEIKSDLEYLRMQVTEHSRDLVNLKTEVHLLDRSERSTIPPAPKGIRSIVPTVQRNVPQITVGTIAATTVVIIDQLISLWMSKGH